MVDDNTVKAVNIEEVRPLVEEAVCCAKVSILIFASFCFMHRPSPAICRAGRDRPLMLAVERDHRPAEEGLMVYELVEGPVCG